MVRLLVGALSLLVAGCMPPSWGANALLHPGRRPLRRQPVGTHENVEIAGDGVTLKGWRFRTDRPKRGTVIYLHGLSDNRGTGVWVAEHFLPRGFDVLAFDSRAHGESGGDACTYGFHEKRDVARAIDTLGGDAVVLFGSSLGAAIALQAAAQDARVKSVVAVATISDLRTAAFERAPFFASRANVEEALRIADEQGKFRSAEVSPVAAAPRIRAPVLIIHGARDVETPAAHSQRVYEALRGPKRLLIVPRAGHNDAINQETWPQIDRWIEESLARH